MGEERPLTLKPSRGRPQQLWPHYTWKIVLGNVHWDFFMFHWFLFHVDVGATSSAKEKYRKLYNFLCFSASVLTLGSPTGVRADFTLLRLQRSQVQKKVRGKKQSTHVRSFSIGSCPSKQALHACTPSNIFINLIFRTCFVCGCCFLHLQKWHKSIQI